MMRTLDWMVGYRNFRAEEFGEDEIGFEDLDYL